MVLGASPLAVEEATTDLADALRAGSHGSLVLKEPWGNIYNAEYEALPFLGRLGEAFQADDGLKIDWRPNDFAFAPIYAAIEAPSVNAATLRACIHAVSQWRSAYPGWHSAKQETSRHLVSLMIALAIQLPDDEQAMLIAEIASYLADIDPSVEWIDLRPASFDLTNESHKRLQARIAGRSGAANNNQAVGCHTPILPVAA